MNKHKLLPNIRFKGFEDEWEDTVLGKFVKVYDGVHQTPKYKNNGVPFVSVENISNLYTNKFISKSDFDNNFKNSKPNSGDLLMTRIGDIGTVNFVKNNNDLAYYVSLALLKPKTKDFKKYMNSYFLMYLIESPRTKKELWKRTLHIAFPKKINKNEISKVNLCICSNWKEQQKIGNLFAKLDKLLGLQRQKIDKLELLKKTLLQKLFPRHEAKIPELRYGEFEVNWITYSFSSLLIKNSSKNKNLEIENIESISNKNGFTKQSEQFDGYRVASLDLSNYYVIKGNQFAYNPSRINVGSIAYKRKGEEDSIISPLYVSFSTKNNINDTFLWYWFKTSSFKKQRIQFSEGGVRDTLPFENLKKMQIKLPRLKEQQKIGNLLSKVDQLIELENKKLENLQQFKKCLLQNMFVE